MHGRQVLEGRNHLLTTNSRFKGKLLLSIYGQLWLCFHEHLFLSLSESRRAISFSWQLVAANQRAFVGCKQQLPHENTAYVWYNGMLVSVRTSVALRRRNE